MKKLFFVIGMILASLTAAMQISAQPSPMALRHKVASTSNRTAFPLGGERRSALPVAASSPQFKAPYQASPVPGTLYGYLAFSYNNQAVFGLNTLSKAGFINGLWYDSIYGTDGAQMSSGWYRDGKVCGFSPLIYSSLLGAQIIYIDYVEFDFATGELLKRERYDSDNRIYMQNAAYNTKDGYVYGYGNNKDGNFVFAKTPVDNPLAVEVVKVITNDSETCFSLTYNAEDNTIYGINSRGQFVKVSVGGVQTVIMSVAEADADSYITGLAYLSTDDRFYWNAIDSYEQSAFYSINIANKKMTKICDFGFEEQFNFLFSLVEEAAANAPARATYVSNTFNKGAQSGAITYTLPSKLNNGDNIDASANLTWELRIDGSVFSNGTAKPGATVDAAANNLARGEHIFSLISKLGTATSVNSPKTLFIGHDNPAAPENVVLSTDGSLSWEAVTQGANNGYVDLDKLVYIIRNQGSEIARTSDTGCHLDLPDGGQLNSYGVEVSAEANGYESTPTSSNRIVLGGALTPDVMLTPTEAESLLFKVVDNNNDGTTWEYYLDAFELPCFYSGYSTKNDMDEWLFLPPVKLDDPTAYYDFTMLARYMQIMYPDEFCEVKIGKTATPSAMTEVIMPNTRMIAPDFETFGGKFKVSEAGTYYIGIHCTSLVDMYGICVSRFQIKKTAANGASPAAVTDLTAKPGANGSYMANVSFKMPTTSLDGKALAADAAITATVTADEVKTVTGTPGSQQSVDILTKEGSNRIMVTTSLNGLDGDIAWVDVFTGVQVPEMVKNLKGKLSADMMSVELTWDAPTTGVTGELINSDDVTYNILLYNNQGSTWAAIATGIEAKTYTFSLPAGTAQSYYGLAVQTENSAGKNNNIRIYGTQLGTPYSLPMFEDFDGDYNNIEPFVVYQPTEDYVTSWEYVATGNLPEATTKFGYSLVATTSRAGTFARMSTPAVTTKGLTEASFDATFYTGWRSAITRVYYQTCDMTEPELLYTPNRYGTWHETSANLPANALDKGWVIFYFDCEFETTNQIFAVDKFGVYARTSQVDSVVATNGSLHSENGAIIAENFEGSEISVYTPDGTLVGHKAKAAAYERFNLAPGVYIVNAGASRAKLIVK